LATQMAKNMSVSITPHTPFWQIYLSMYDRAVNANKVDIS
jgi:hypothetical protein